MSYLDKALEDQEKVLKMIYQQILIDSLIKEMKKGTEDQIDKLVKDSFLKNFQK